MMAPDGTFYRWHGAASGPVVVLIHGLGLNHAQWAPQLDALADFRVLCYDLIGHGASPAPQGRCDLRDLSAQLARLLDHCGVQAAAVVGFSMGGMVARRFAQDYPHRVLALGVLNSGHRRSEKAQDTILSRVEQAREFGPAATVERALERWFTPGFHAANPQVIDRVRQWVLANDPAIYHHMYRILAEDLDQIIAPNPPILAASLIMTSTGDYGQSPEMAQAIAAEIPGAQVVIIPDLNHMAPTQNPAAYNEPLVAFLTTALGTFDARALRAAFGSFATGVTIVTTRQGDGTPRGFTANSFTSVSLDPPLLLVCLAKSAASLSTFSTAPFFAVNVLGEGQKALSGLFASPTPDKFAQVEWVPGHAGVPVIAESLTHFACARHQVVDAGDHVILIGRIVGFQTAPGLPLGYFRGNYFTIGLEDTLVQAAAHGDAAQVGAILQQGDAILMHVNTGNAKLSVPKAPPTAPSPEGLAQQLATKGVSAQIDFLYAVYQDRDTGAHAIFYHGHAQGAAPIGYAFMRLTPDALARVANAAERAMLTRYAEEYRHGEFGIYQGNETSGQVRRLSAPMQPR